ncbi:MAG: V-type ATP synthase subunit I [Bacteroidota bacterium]
MSVDRMQRVALYGRERDREEILGLVQSLAVLDPEGTPTPGETGSQVKEIDRREAALNREVAALEHFLTFLDRHHPVRPNLIEQFAGVKTVLTEEEFAALAEDREAAGRLIQEASGAEASLADIAARRQESLNRQAALSPWRALTLTRDELSGTKRVQLLTGFIDARHRDEFAARLAERDPRPVLIPVGGDGTQEALVLIVPRRNAADLTQAAVEMGFSPASLPPFTGTVAEALDREAAVLADLERQEEGIRARLAELAGERRRVQALLDQCQSMRRRLETARGLLLGARSFGLEGWIPARRVEELRQALTRSGLPFHLEAREPAAGEAPPIELANGPVVTPFEALVQNFNYPQYQEIDPTPAIAPFFLIFFGFCLGDAGYGLVLSLFCLGLLWRLKMKPMGRKLAMVFVLGGLAAVVMGFVTRSVFGFTVNLPFPFHVDIMKQAIVLLVAALGLGTIQLFLGTVLSALPALRERRFADALFGQGVWLLFLSAVMLVVGKDAIGLGAYGGALKYLLAISVIGVIIGAMRGRKGILGKILGIPAGLFTIYGSIGFFSDILSYSRLMALGLSGGVMATIINLFAGMAWKAGYGVGQLGGAAIFLFGHAMNLALGILGAYVHSSRLQYLEFFGKFFEGGGRAFNPLRPERKHTFVVKQKEA